MWIVSLLGDGLKRYGKDLEAEAKENWGLVSQPREETHIRKSKIGRKTIINGR